MEGTTTKINDVPVEVLFEDMVYPECGRMMGGKFRIAHLKSDRGKALNGRTCVVTGFDRNEQARLHCKIEGVNEKPIGVKYGNLIPLAATQALDNFMTASTPIADNVLLPYLKRVIRKHNINPGDRADFRHRVKLFETLSKKIENGTANEADYCLPCGAGKEKLEQDNFGRIMQMMKPACFGNEVCDVRYMDIGLKGDGQSSEGGGSFQLL